MKPKYSILRYFGSINPMRFGNMMGFNGKNSSENLCSFLILLHAASLLTRLIEECKLESPVWKFVKLVVGGLACSITMHDIDKTYHGLYVWQKPRTSSLKLSVSYEKDKQKSRSQTIDKAMTKTARVVETHEKSTIWNGTLGSIVVHWISISQSFEDTRSNWFTLLLLCTSAPLILCCDRFDRGSRQAKRETW